MKQNFDLLIFDWDGTLADSIDWIVRCVEIAAQQCELIAPNQTAIKAIIGLSIQQAMRTLFPQVDEIMIQKLVRHYSQAFASQPITPQHLFNGVEVMLQDFKRSGYRLAVATGKSRAGLDRALIGTKIGDLFEITRCADETASKPNPLMLQQILSMTQADPKRSLMIGDSLHDLQMAQHAGIAAIAVSCGADSAETLINGQPLLCLSQTIELHPLMNRLH